MRRSATVLFGVLGVLAGMARGGDVAWPQFRGPNGIGVGEAQSLPVRFGPNENLVWEAIVPKGASSPCIWGDRIFLTGVSDGRLETLAVDRKTGRILWHRPAPKVELEDVHNIYGSPAAPTPATDGQRVYVYFGSYGLLCYDFTGKELWKKPLPKPITVWGSSTSPIVAGDRVLLKCDQDVGSYLLAVDARSGKTIWKTERPGFPKGFATPMVWNHDGIDEVIVPGTLRLKAYDLEHGKERWSVAGLARIVCPTPVTGQGLLFVSAWTPGADPGDRIKAPSFDEQLAKNDKNKDGKITLDEVHEDALRRRFRHFDANKDGVVLRDEWNSMVHVFDKAQNVLLAIRPGGKGDVTDTHIVWKQTRYIPYVPSPLYYRGRIHLVKDLGITSCYDAATGKPLYQERLGVRGNYYASPVAGDGKIYMASEPGVVAVLRAGDTLDVLARNDLGEPILATPAIVDGKLYVRTEGHLYAFGK